MKYLKKGLMLLTATVVLSNFSFGQVYYSSSDWNTTKGNAVSHLHLNEIYGDPGFDISSALEEWILAGYPGTTTLKSATSKYNCHGYAHANAHEWFNNESVYGRFMVDDYEQFTPTKLGVGDSEANVPSQYGPIAFYMRKRSAFITESEKEAHELKIQEKVQALLNDTLTPENKFSVILANSESTVEHHIKSFLKLLDIRLTGDTGAKVVLSRLENETDQTYATILVYILKEINYKPAINEIARRILELDEKSYRLTDSILFSAFEELSRPDRKTYIEKLKQEAKTLL